MSNMEMVNALLSPGAPNLSLFSFPVLLALTYAPHFVAVSAASYKRLGGHYWPNHMPRAFVTQLAARPVLEDRKAKLTKLERFVLRCEGCQQNNVENLPIILVALVSGGYLNRMAAWYMGLRFVYTILYMFTDDLFLSSLRSGAHYAQVYLYIQVMRKAAAKFVMG
ncbi:hypothetical protein MSPP1_002322 [Malassezia sp. CBS 17886]|nr:hypothetical protein MSPP1_002322 [Malassezia sp. CBS 17886]